MSARAPAIPIMPNQRHGKPTHTFSMIASRLMASRIINPFDYFGDTFSVTDFASALAASSIGSLNFTESTLQRPPLPSRQ